MKAAHEHEFEPALGLPERLPPGETVVWQGAPKWQALARDAFHLRGLSLYFAVLLAWQTASHLHDGQTWAATLFSLLTVAPLALLALALVASLAWLSARSTVYTLTNHRLVMRVGIVLTVTYNLPLAQIAAVAMRRRTGGLGDLTVTLESGQRIAYLHLWPHARPWHLRTTEPMLRDVESVEAVAALFADTLHRAVHHPLRATTAPQPAAIDTTTPSSRRIGNPVTA